MKMKGIALACIFIVSALHQGVRARRPSITPAESWEVIEDGVFLIQEGDELRIECQGGDRLQFSTQKMTENVEPSKFTTSVNEATGVYALICPNATIRNTGWYACAEEGVDIRNDVQTIGHPSEDISWIYVYVNSSEPFAVMDAFFEPVIMITGSDGVIPCRPTSPDLPVILEIQGGDTPVPEGTKYDPRIGFIFEEIGKERTGESYTCKLNGTDAESEDIQWPLYYAVVEANTPLEAPKINKDRLHHVVWGTNLTLECEINVDEIKFRLKWIVPSSIPKERLVNSEQLVLVNMNGSQETWKTELTILNVERTDGGKYICVAQNLHGDETQSSTEIQIFDPDFTYINVRVYSHDDIGSSEGDAAEWIVWIETYPEEFNWEWYKKDGTLIKTTDVDVRSRFSHTCNGYYHSFKISSLSIQDSGRYTLRVSTAIEEESITLSLTVVGQPVVHIDNSLALYALGATVAFTARIFASPLPNVTWTYIEYPDFPSKEHSTQILLSNLHQEWINWPPFHLTSRVNVTINMTGDLVCRCCNDINCTESIRQILLSDVAGFFGIRNPGIVTEGDDAAVTCGASVYNYTDNVIWKYKDFNEEDLESDRIYVTKRVTKFTSQSILHLRDVRLSDSGKYTCEAVNKEGRLERETYQLRVEVARPPKFTSTDMNYSEISIDLRKDNFRAVTLECRADGRPIPTITWYKNNEPLKESGRYMFSDNNSKLRIVYFHDADTDRGRYSCIARNRVGMAERYMDIKITDSAQIVLSKSPISSGTEKSREISHEIAYPDPGTSPLVLQNELLVKQIHAAEAQERAAFSFERVATTAQRFIEQLYKRFFPQTNTD